MHGLICGTDYIKVRGRHNIEIVAYVKNGLQPYDELGIPILPPEVAALIYLIRELGYDIECIEMDFPEFKDGDIGRDYLLSNKQINLEFPEKIYYWAGNIADVKEEYELKKTQLEHSENKLNKYYELPSWKGYQCPVKPEDRKLVINELLNALYKWEDILELEKVLGMEDIFKLEKELRIDDQTNDKVVLNQMITQQEDIEKTAENSFSRKGTRPDETWEVCFKGKKLNPIVGSDGMVYIANLLLKPCQHIHVTDLCDSVHHKTNIAMMEKVI
jgi:hypothetical protein